MKELSVEEKAKRFDEAINKIMDYRNGKTKMYTDVNKAIDYLFPELAESEDEKIRKAIITYLSTIDDKDLVPWESWIAWLEKQGEHAKFCDSIQVGDKVTRNQDGMLVNLSQLNRVAKKDEKQGEQKPAEWSEDDQSNFNELSSFILEAYRAEDASGLITWLKSLKERYTWKPSEEMLEALYRAIPENVMEISEDEMLLDKLYQGLKYGRVLGKN